MNFIVCPFVVGPQMTRRCLQSALDQDVEDPVVLAIDNGSTDGTGVAVRSLPVLYWYRSTRSLHAIWNEALSYAFTRLELPRALVINNDLVLRPDTFRLLASEQADFVTGVAVEKLDDMRQYDIKSKRPHPSFSCFMISRECWQRVGKFDEAFWAWCGDGDYHLRMDAAGIDAYSVALPFFHEISGTLKHSPAEQRDALCRLSDQDRELFIKKWGCAIGSPDYYERFRHAREPLYQTTGRLS